jgi:hypothetical protein
MTMKLLWAGVIFGAGYVLGRPEGRAKLAELVARPEVAQLRQQAASTVSSAAKTGQQQLTKTAQKVKQAASEKRTGMTGDGSTVVTERVAARRGLRLSPFRRRGVGPDSSVVPAAGPIESPTGIGTDEASTRPVNGVTATPS